MGYLYLHKTNLLSFCLQLPLRQHADTPAARPAAETWLHLERTSVGVAERHEEPVVLPSRGAPQEHGAATLLCGTAQPEPQRVI